MSRDEIGTALVAIPTCLVLITTIFVPPNWKVRILKNISPILTIAMISFIALSAYDEYKGHHLHYVVLAKEKALQDSEIALQSYYNKANDTHLLKSEGKVSADVITSYTYLQHCREYRDRAYSDRNAHLLFALLAGLLLALINQFHSTLKKNEALKRIESALIELKDKNVS